MRYDNDAKQLKYEVLRKVAEHSFAGTLEENINQIPYDLIPGPQPKFRCCIYREREIIRERVSAARGLSMPGQPENAIIGVLPAACEGCPISRFTVTSNCQHCLAKKCQAACPFGAISITGQGAYIDPNKCKECGRCAAACPYNAISDTLRPCLRSCPVDAITMDENRRAAIQYENCISCGTCANSCPFGALTDRSYMTKVIDLIRDENTEVYASFAPAIEGHFGMATVGSLKAALVALGFTGAYEVSLGADATAAHEAEELAEAIEEGRKMTTSCCPAFVEMIEKHFPKLTGLISHTGSPMVLTARYLHQEHPGAKVVFIGPCMAKKLEIQKVQETADLVLTFEELAAMFDAREIDPAKKAEQEQDGSLAGKNFATSGGVTASVQQVFKERGIELKASCLQCNGARECKKALTLLNLGRLPEDFLEGMACEGGCIAGPGGVESPVRVKKNRAKLLAQADSRGVVENIQQIHDYSDVNMDAR